MKHKQWLILGLAAGIVSLAHVESASAEPCDPAVQRVERWAACTSRYDFCFEITPTRGECRPRDADGDGVDSLVTGGSDCDDNDRNRFPGNTEVCDPDGHDEDCDYATFGNRDADGDGYFDAMCTN